MKSGCFSVSVSILPGSTTTPLWQAAGGMKTVLSAKLRNPRIGVNKDKQVTFLQKGSKSSQKFWSESWVSPIAMVIYDTSIYKLGGSSIPWRQSVVRMVCQPRYKGRTGSFSSPEAPVGPLSYSSWEWGCGTTAWCSHQRNCCQGRWVILHSISMLSPDSKTLMGNTGEGKKSLSQA